MNIIEYYLLLRLQYQEYRCHQSFYVSLNELARVLCCSTRNVKRLLRKMVDDQLIFFKPGGGRGKRSKLQFRRPLHHVFPLYIQFLIQQGQFREAVRWIKREGIPAKVREQCYRELLRHLSFPGIPLHEINGFQQHSFPVTPTMIASSTGKWYLVERND
jgi:MarR-like DNA-binding transcriptional regulator SgrR of sgrS sRNA